MSEEICLERHKKEKKDLQAKIQKLKTSVPKGDKKKRKEVNSDIVVMEREMSQRHAQELNAFKDSHQLEEVIVEELEKAHISEEAPIEEPPPPSEPQAKVSRAQRRKEKKAKKDAERVGQVDDGQMTGPNERLEEEKAFTVKLLRRNLKLCAIASDGNCMYAAFSHQLQQQGIQSCVKSLRKSVSNYMLQQAERFLPYYTGDEDFEEYCRKVEKTSEWGGEFELRALSELYQTPIEIIQAGETGLVIGEHLSKQPSVILTYHLHAFRLGAHYNSVQPIHFSNNGNNDDNIHSID